MLSTAVVGLNGEAPAIPKSAESMMCRSISKLTLYTKRKMKNVEVNVCENFCYQQKKYLLA